MRSLLLLLAAAACRDSAGDTSDTAIPLAPLAIDSFAAVCLAPAEWHAEVIATRETSGVAVLNVWDTGEIPFSGEYLLTTTATGPYGELLEHGEPGTAPLDCPAGRRTDLLGGSSTLTFAVRVYEADGTLADCAAFGHRPAVVADGTFPTTGGLPSDPNELSGCTLR